MTIVVRHGGEAHVMRPDRVYRTSVLAPMMNYSPQADVQAVAYAFTQGPPLGTMLQGFGQPMTLGDKIRAFFARFKGGAAQMPMPQMIVNQTPAPAIAEAGQVAPQMRTQMHMLMQLSRNSMMPGVSTAARALARRRYLTFYKAG